jgi:hypothetical protein
MQIDRFARDRCDVGAFWCSALAAADAQGVGLSTLHSKRNMGIKNYLIDGVSCADKTTVCDELQRRGYHAIHGDKELAYWGDPKTGQPVLISLCRHYHYRPRVLTPLI